MSTNTVDFDRKRGTLHITKLALLALMSLAVLALLFMIVKPVKVLPRLTQAPTYTLQDQNGEPFSDDNLRGKIVLYDFIYTSCTTVCPAMTGQMLQVQQELAERGWLGDDVVLVSITFDPERDTPERLREYVAQMQVSPEGWYWLTGDLMTIKQLVGGEFGVYFEKAPLDEAAAEAAGLTPEERADNYDFIHASVFVLVDENGQIRAEYHELIDVDQILRDIELAVREKNAQGIGRLVRQAAHLVKAYP